MPLLDMCDDVLLLILEEVELADLASCAATCRSLHEFIAEEKNALFRTHYLNNWASLTFSDLD